MEREYYYFIIPQHTRKAPRGQRWPFLELRQKGVGENGRCSLQPQPLLGSEFHFLHPRSWSVQFLGSAQCLPAIWYILPIAGWQKLRVGSHRLPLLANEHLINANSWEGLGRGGGWRSLSYPCTPRNTNVHMHTRQALSSGTHYLQQF